MAYWAFGLAQDGGIDALLDKWDPDAVDAAADNHSSESEKTSTAPSNGKGTTAGTINSSPSIGIAEDETPEASTSKQSGKTSKSLTLEQLLDEDDLLQELKNGHAKLVSLYRASATYHLMLRDANHACFSVSVMLSYLSRSSTFYLFLRISSEY